MEEDKIIEDKNTENQDNDSENIENSDNNENSEDVKNEEEEKVVPPPVITVVISGDKMTAYVRIKTYADDQKIVKEDILGAINEKKIKYGILEEEIEKFCELGEYKRELKAVRGLPATKGANGSIEYHFQKVMSGKPHQRDDGTLDYKTLDIIQNITKGALLCTMVMPLDGTDGINILGQRVKGKRGDMPDIPQGDNIIISEDSTQITAKIDGGISFKKNTIYIEEVYTINENIGPITGNIDYNGSVVINGSVQEGFEVIAKDDITIKGAVEGAKISAGGNVLIKNGVHGMHKAVIEAGNNITSTYIENAETICGGSLYADIVLNSKVNAGEEIILRGKKGMLRGGTYKAGKCINVKTIGNFMNITQLLNIEPCWYELYKLGLEEHEENPEIKRERLLKERAKLQIQLDIINKENTNDPDPKIKSQKMRSNLMRKLKVNREIDELDSNIDSNAKFLEVEDLKIICTGEMHIGTKIKIGNTILKINDMVEKQKFFVYEGEIIKGEILPHEMDVS